MELRGGDVAGLETALNLPVHIGVTQDVFVSSRSSLHSPLVGRVLRKKEEDGR